MIAMANYCVRLLLTFFFLSRSLLLIVFFFSFREGIRKTWKQQLEKSQATNKKNFFLLLFHVEAETKTKERWHWIDSGGGRNERETHFFLQFIKNFLMKYFDISD